VLVAWLPAQVPAGSDEAEIVSAIAHWLTLPEAVSDYTVYRHDGFLGEGADGVELAGRAFAAAGR
jgi:hypothetical protein